MNDKAKKKICVFVQTASGADINARPHEVSPQDEHRRLQGGAWQPSHPDH